MSHADLEALRVRIDQLDEDLVELLGRRFRVTEEVGRLKASAALNAVDSQRQSAQEARLAALAAKHGVNPDLVTRIFRAIVEEVVSNHRAVASARRSTS